MIRILHSVSYMSRGGIETMLMNYYRHMDRDIIQFDFLCHSNNEGAYDKEVEELGGRIHRTPSLNPLKFRKYLEFMKELFAAHPEYRIVESHNGPFGVYSLCAAKKYNIPVRIYHAHGASLPLDIKFPLKFFCKSMLKYYMNKHFVCGRKAGEFYMGKDIMNNNDYTMIPNAIEVEKFIFDTEKRKKIREQYGINDKLVIGHVGRFSYQKNHEFLLKIFAEACKSNNKLILALLGKGKLMDNVQKQAQELNISDKIIYVGNVPNTDEWYNAFDLFLLPSRWEGLPVVGIEAQASDLPCIFSTAVTNEVALTDKTTFIDLKDPVNIWAKKINEIIENKEFRNNNYNLLTEKNYNIKTEAKKLQELYISIYNETI